MTSNGCFILSFFGVFIWSLITLGLISIIITGTMGILNSDREQCTIEICSSGIELWKGREVRVILITLLVNKTIDDVEQLFNNTIKYEDIACPKSNQIECYYSYTYEDVYLFRIPEPEYVFLIFVVICTCACLIWNIHTLKSSI